MFSDDELELIKYFENIRSDFPILKQKINGKKLVYVDNGASTQKPKIMVEAIVDYYSNYNSNIHRSAHSLAQKADLAYSEVRVKVAKFIGSKSNEIIFTKGSTDSLNKVAFGLEDEIKKGDEILLSVMEHHANLVPWQELAKKTGAVLKFVHLDSDYRFDFDEFKKLISKNTKIVSFTHISNVLGSVNPISKISKLIREVIPSAFFVVDAAQSIGHMKIDVKKLDCDFLVFSAHKMAGPTGLGILYAKFSSLEKLKPIEFGGDMIYEVGLMNSTYNEIPFKFEAGTPNIGAVIAFGKTLDYLNMIGMDRIEKYEKILMKYFLKKSLDLGDKFILFGSKNTKDRVGVFSFNIKYIHSHDVSSILDKFGIAVRGGHHCAMPLHVLYELSSSSRISFYFYNTISEIDYIIDVLKKLKNEFDKGNFLI